MTDGASCPSSCVAEPLLLQMELCRATMGPTQDRDWTGLFITSVREFSLATQETLVHGASPLYIGLAPCTRLCSKDMRKYL